MDPELYAMALGLPLTAGDIRQDMINNDAGIWPKHDDFLGFPDYLMKNADVRKLARQGGGAWRDLIVLYGRYKGYGEDFDTTMAELQRRAGQAHREESRRVFSIKRIALVKDGGSFHIDFVWEGHDGRLSYRGGIREMQEGGPYWMLGSKRLEEYRRDMLLVELASHLRMSDKADDPQVKKASDHIVEFMGLGPRDPNAKTYTMEEVKERLRLRMEGKDPDKEEG